MWRDLVVAVALTLAFSIGVGVLFVRTVVEMLGLLFPKTPPRPARAEAASGRRPLNF
jgi:hypothetical protein